MAEEPLPKGGSCLLGSINLSNFVMNPFTSKAHINMSELMDAVDVAVRALNDVLMEGLSLHPLEEQRESVANWRQIGLGTLGLGDMLIKLGIKYGSEAVPIIEKVYQTIAVQAIVTSLTMAKEKGAFPKCTPEIREAIVKSDFIKALNLDDTTIASQIRVYGLYNSQLLTCAPTGTIGTMFQVSTGVEPNYAFSYNRRTVSLNSDETVYQVDAKIVEEYKKATGKEKLPDYFVASAEIPYRERIAVQAALQKYIDASISSTINLPHDTTVEEIADIYMEAWKAGLKGVTIWRDGCQRQSILSAKDDKPEEPKDEYAFVPVETKKVTDDCIGRKRTLVTGCGTLHLTAFFSPYNGQLLETYFSKGSAGGCQNFMVGLSRMVSLCARSNVPIERIVDQLKSSGTCPSYAVRTATKHDTSKGSSCPVAIGNALMDMYRELQEELQHKGPLSIRSKKEEAVDVDSPKCPKCGEPIQMVEGCMTCPSCGYSRCS